MTAVTKEGFQLTVFVPYPSTNSSNLPVYPQKATVAVNLPESPMKITPAEPQIRQVNNVTKTSETAAVNETFIAPTNMIEELTDQDHLPAPVDEQLSFMSSSSTESCPNGINNTTTDSGAYSDSEDSIHEITRPPKER